MDDKTSALLKLSERELLAVIESARVESVSGILDARSRALFMYSEQSKMGCAESVGCGPTFSCSIPDLPVSPRSAPNPPSIPSTPVPPIALPGQTPPLNRPQPPLASCQYWPDGADRLEYSLDAFPKVKNVSSVLVTKHQRALYWAITAVEHRGALALKRDTIDGSTSCVLPVAFESRKPDPEITAVADAEYKMVFKTAGLPLHLELNTGRIVAFPSELVSDTSSLQAVHSLFQATLKHKAAPLLRHFSLGATDQYLLYSRVYTEWSKAKLNGTLLPRTEWPESWDKLSDRYNNVDFIREILISVSYLHISEAATVNSTADRNSGSPNAEYRAKVQAAYDTYMQRGV